LLEVACHSVGVSLARLIDEHLPIPGCRICGRAPGDCQHARSTAVHKRCAIYYPQLPACFCRPRNP